MTYDNNDNIPVPIKLAMMGKVDMRAKQIVLSYYDKISKGHNNGA